VVPQLIYTPRIPLASGTRIGSYDILSALGAGGMGEVYRARDTKLNRDVAIKVLLRAVANDPDRLARFSREAQVLASLNHPNIAAIYGIEESNRVTALVMELVEGEDLSQRIARGAIPVNEALPIARQIAEALEAAHDHGIIHRDLKPANIKVRHDGTVKVLDFGLAKAIDPNAGSNVSAMNSPTLSIHATQAGIILGTAAYMSPEQARGKFVDRRTDIWAFGAVLFEMLTGQRAFPGEDVTDTIIAVCSKEPPWNALPTLPANVNRVLRRGLEKDVKRRLDSAPVLRLEIDDATPAEILAVPGSSYRPRLLPWGVVAILVAGAIAWNFWGRSESTPMSRLVSRFALQAPVGMRLAGRPALSPDGTQIVYAVEQGGVRRLFLRRIDQFDATPLVGTDGASSPAFSPDGQWLVFLADSKLQKMSLAAAAAPVTFSVLNNTLGGVSWTSADTIVFGQFQHGLSTVSSEGGEPRAITKLTSPDQVDHHNPIILPGGKAVMFTSHHGKEQFSVVVESLASGERKVLIESGFDARYLASGHLVYGAEQAVLAVSFDLSRLEVTGAPVRLVEHVANTPLSGFANYALSASGTLVYQPEQGISGRAFVWVDPLGVESVLPISARGFSGPKISPDGKRLAFAVADGDSQDIWTYELAADRLSRVTLGGLNRWPAWSADGRRLTYVSVRAGVHELVSQVIDASSQTLLSSQSTLAPAEWTTDDRALIYSESPPNGLTETLVFRPDNAAPRSTALRHAANAGDRAPSLSPDGRWLAYMSDATGPYEICVAPFPATGARHLVSVDGGESPLWRRDGRELSYRRVAAVFTVSVDTTKGFSAGKPMHQFDGGYVSTVFSMAGSVDYDRAPDGRFLLVKLSEEEKASPRLNVVVNWTDELARRVTPGVTA
jgi:Tol biopolymer transport system component/tRNA A-37 threonylcarbamoyl transferase component Bud32